MPRAPAPLLPGGGFLSCPDFLGGGLLAPAFLGGGLLERTAFPLGGGLLERTAFPLGGGLVERTAFPLGGGLVERTAFPLGGGLVERTAFPLGGGLFERAEGAVTALSSVFGLLLGDVGFLLGGGDFAFCLGPSLADLLGALFRVGSAGALVICKEAKIQNKKIVFIDDT